MWNRKPDEDLGSEANKNVLNVVGKPVIDTQFLLLWNFIMQRSKTETPSSGRSTCSLGLWGCV